MRLKHSDRLYEVTDLILTILIPRPTSVFCSYTDSRRSRILVDLYGNLSRGTFAHNYQQFELVISLILFRIADINI